MTVEGAKIDCLILIHDVIHFQVGGNDLIKAKEKSP